MQRNGIGLQLYTLRGRTAEDFLGTLSQVAEMGYSSVEFAGYGGLKPAELRTALDGLGLQALSSHVPFADLKDGIAGVLGDLQALGCRFAVVPIVPEEWGSSYERVQRLAETLNSWGAMCLSEGVRLGYHNHAWEFRRVDGSTIFDILAAETDPSLVHLQLDLYWATYAGLDPVSLINRHAGRLPLLHVKDVAGSEDRSDVPVGTGVLPWDQILAASEAAGTQWYIVEQDHPRAPLEDVRVSIRNLKRMIHRAT